MPIPVITDGIQAPQIQGPLDTYAKGVQLKSLLGQQQLQQGQIQEQGLQLQQQKQAVADQQAMTKSLQGWDGKDLNELPHLVLKNGGSANAVFATTQHIFQQKQATQALDAETLKNNATKNDLLLGKLQAATSTDDAHLGQSVAQAAQDAVQQGLLDPQKAQGFIQAASTSTDPKALRSQLTIMEKSLMGQKEIFDQETKNRDTVAKEQEAQAKVLGAQNTSTRLQAEMPGGAMQPVEQKELSDYMAKNPGKGPVDFAKFKASLAPQAQVNVQMGGAGPQADALVDAVGQNKMKISDALPMRAPVQVRQAFLNKVLAKYPDFNSASYDVEKGVMKDFTSGASAKNLTAFNTAIDHAGQLDKAVDALKNGDMRMLNKIGNEAGYQFGSDATTNFNVIKNALSGEISKVFKGGQATDAEIHAVQAPFDSANSPQQLKGAIKQAISLMNSKRDALKQQYQSGSKAQPNFGQGGNAPAAEHPFFSQFGGATKP
jgi:hypothetical protein